MKYMIVKIPHQSPVRVWDAANDERIIEIAATSHDLYYESWTAEDAADCFDDGDMPDDLKAILDEHGEAMQVGHSGDTHFATVADAGTELDAAMEAIGHDLSSCYFLPYHEAQEWAEAYTGHQAIEARKAIRKIMEP